MEEIYTLFIGALALARGALRLEPVAFDAALSSTTGGALALIVLWLGGLSDVLGQSVVLLANRIKPGRFVISIVSAVLVLALSVGFWAASIWLTSTFLLGVNRPLGEVLSVVYLSYAPLLFGIFVFLPYLGNYIFRVLRIWIFLALIVGVQQAYDFNFWQALLCCALGWIVYELLTRLPLLRIERLSRWWWRVTTGTPEPIDIQARADELAERGKLLLTERFDKAAKGSK